MTEKKEIDLEKYENIDLVFDVESEALDREGFAYGYVVTATNKETGEVEEIEAGEMYSIEGAKNAVPWVQENVIPVLPVGEYLEAEATASLPEHIVRTNAEVRQSFFDVMTRWKQSGADIWSDVNWPVEARFMHDTIADGKDYSRPEQMAAAEQKVLNFIDQVLIDGNRENINKENLISAAKQFQSEFNRVGDNMPGKDNPSGRMFAGPFPMKDVSTVIGEVHMVRTL